MLIHWIWLAQKKFSCAQKWQLLQHFADPEDIYHAEEQALKETGVLSDEALTALEDKDLTSAQSIARYSSLLRQSPCQ